VIKGNGPCNAQRVAQRKAAHDNGAWVREAAAAHAAKQAAKRAAPDSATKNSATKDRDAG